MSVSPSPPSASALFQWRDDPRRSLIIGAVGAMLGLAIAGFGLFTAKGTAVRSVPPEDAAVVNQKPILASDLAIQVQAQLNRPITQATPAERRQVLDGMIGEELLVQRGLELDEPETDPDTRAALVAAVQAQVAVDATSQVPGDVELRDVYERRREHYARMGSMTVRDLLAPGGATGETAAKRAVAALRAGQPLATVLHASGLADSGRVSGEELYFAAKIHLGDALFGRAAALGDGQVADPVLDHGGWHVLLMTHNDRPTPRSFDEARSQVYADYKEDLMARLRDGESRYLRGKADIAIAPAYR